MIPFYDINDDLSGADKNAVIYLLRKNISFNNDFIMDSSVVGDYGSYLFDFKSDFHDNGLIFEDDVSVPLRVKLSNPLFLTGSYHIVLDLRCYDDIGSLEDDNQSNISHRQVKVTLVNDEWVDIDLTDLGLINIIDYDFKIIVDFKDPLIVLKDFMFSDFTCDKSILALSEHVNILLSATLVDINNNPLADKVISFYKDLTLLGTGVTDSSGVATLTYSFSETGDFNLFAQHKIVSSSNYNVKVVENASTIILTSNYSTVNVNDRITLTAELNNIHDEIEDVSLSFYEGETLIGTVTTDSNGVAVLANYQVSSHGIKSFCVKYSTFESNTVNVTANNAMNISCNVPSSSANRGDNVYIYGRLAANNWQDILGGRTVKLYNGSSVIANLTTDNDGWFGTTVNYNCRGTWSIRAEFEGETDYPACSSSTTNVTVNGIASTISCSVNVSEVDYGGIVIFTGHCSVPNTTVYITLKAFGSQTWGVRTDANGNFTDSIRAYLRGVNEAYASYRGDCTYYGCVSDVSTINVI